eukprot:g1213.t1
MDWIQQGAHIERGIDDEFWFEAKIVQIERDVGTNEIISCNVKYLDEKGNIEENVPINELREYKENVPVIEEKCSLAEEEKETITEGKEEEEGTPTDNVGLKEEEDESEKTVQETVVPISVQIRRLVEETTQYVENQKQLKAKAKLLLQEHREVSQEVARLQAYKTSLELMNTGSLLQERGENDEAYRLFVEALRKCPDNKIALYKVGALAKGKYWKNLQSILPTLTEGNEEINSFPSTAPKNYVIELFDKYAKTFDTELVQKLRYQVPKLIANDIASRTFAPPLTKEKTDTEPMINKVPADSVLTFSKKVIIDLGCGTGLCGHELTKRYGKSTFDIHGVDLSTQMIEHTRARHCYTSLHVGDVNEYLQETWRKDTECHVIIAADVIPYMGANTTELFQNVAQVLGDRGYFIFTTELLQKCTQEEDEEEDSESSSSLAFRLLETERFAHSDTFIKSLAKQFSFKIVYDEVIPIRSEGQTAIQGSLTCLQLLK